MLLSGQPVIFLGVLVATFLLMKWRNDKKRSINRYPPSIPSIPLFGSVGLLFMKDLTNVAALLMKKSRELGPIFTFRIGNTSVVALNSKDAIEKALEKNGSTFSDKPKLFLEALVNPDNKGVAHKRKAADWKKVQQLALSVLKEFGFGAKNMMETRIYEEIEAMSNYARKRKGESFDPKEMCILTTSNIIMNIIFGRRRDYELGLSETCIQAHRLASDFDMVYDIVPFIRFFPPYNRKVKAFAETCQATFDCIDQEITESTGDTAKPCFVQTYIKKIGSTYDRAQLNYTLRDLITAGTDTSATTLLWGLVALANNPEVQKRLQEEINAVVTGDRLPSLQDQPNLPYVEATILELTRWRTLLPISMPRSASRNSIIDGYFIPGGMMVFSNLYAVHNDINLWGDPEVFRPERFLDTENSAILKDNVIPFSVGRRSCLGETLARAELFLIFTSLVKRFIVLPPEGQEKVNDELQLPVMAIAYPTPIKIRLIERN